MLASSTNFHLYLVTNLFYSSHYCLNSTMIYLLVSTLVLGYHYAITIYISNSIIISILHSYSIISTL